MRKLLKIFAIACLTLIFTAALSIYLLMRSPVRAGRLDLQAVARMYPNFTMQQRLAVLRQLQSEVHPHWKDLSAAEIVRRIIARVSASSNGLTPPANFSGNMTTVALASNHLMVLVQQADCSLTLQDSVYTYNSTGPVFSYVVAASTPNYQQVLHTAAGLTTTGGKYPSGCGNTTTGTPSREVVAGATSSGMSVYAGNFFYGQNQAFQVAANANGTFQSFNSLGEVDSVVDLTISDMNGDGNSDLLLINDSLSSTGNATVSIALGKANGTFAAPTDITLPDNYVYSAVVDDFNGDGKKDIVVSTSQGSYQGQNATYSINFLAGKGDGTFQPVQSYAVTPPSELITGSNSPYFGLISTDLRGSGHKDLITSSGIILFGNGDGTFTQSTTLAFPNSMATSDYGPSVAAADFNNDGKPDLAVNNGATIQICLGNGDGTFTLNSAYATISNMGYLVAQDLDGDGNIDLFSGTGNDGTLGGDKFDYNMGYALMGNGDGTFRGASSLPVFNSGTNLGDINGDGKLDLVGINGTSFAPYLNNGDGTFTAGAPLAVPTTFVLGGQTYTAQSTAVSFAALADVTGDGKADLIFTLGVVGSVVVTAGNTPVYFVAKSNGDGSFATPVPAEVSLVPTGDADYEDTLYGLQIADFNANGHPDLIFTYTVAPSYNAVYSQGFAILLGNGDGTFKPPVLETSYSSKTEPSYYLGPQIAAIGDVNNDHKPDLMVIAETSNPSGHFPPNTQMELLLGNGDGTFGKPSVIATASNPGLPIDAPTPAILTDLNSDGRLDLICLGDTAASQGQLAISLGNGDGTFAAPSILNTTDGDGDVIYADSLAAADFNGDGKVDIAVSSFESSASGIYFGNGDGTITNSNSTSPVNAFYLEVGGLAVASDFNGDGKPDLLFGNTLLINTYGASPPPLTTTTASLSASAASITAGASVTLTATIHGASGSTGVPTGTVSFLDGSTKLGTGTLNTSGQATYSTSSLAVGAHSITAAYGGDTNFAASTSSAVSVTVSAPVPADFAISLSPATASVSAGSTATSTVSIAPSGGFNSQVSLACTGLPLYSTCSFSPATVTPNGSAAASTTLTVATDVAAASIRGPNLPNRSRPEDSETFLALLLLGLGGLVRQRRKSNVSCWRTLLSALLVAGVATALVACGGGGGSGSSGGGTTTPAGTSTVTVTATSGSLSKTATFTFTVQ